MADVQAGAAPTDAKDEPVVGIQDEEPPSKRTCTDATEDQNNNADAQTPAEEPVEGAQEGNAPSIENKLKEPIKIGYKTFSTGKECYDYFHHIMKNYRKKQNLNEVNAVNQMATLCFPSKSFIHALYLTS